MEQSTIRVAEVEHAGTSHKAAYFVEAGIIHASIGGRVMRFPVIYSVAPENAVRALLIGHLQHTSRKAANAALFVPKSGPADEAHP